MFIKVKIEEMFRVSDMQSSSRRSHWVVKKVEMHAQKDDVTYWRQRPYLERIAALEEIRQDYITWKYGAQPRLQRVYRIIKW